MRHQLRDYQLRTVERTLALYQQGTRSVLIVSPMGSGKTVMATAIVEASAVPTLVVAHRRELISQAADKLQGNVGKAVSRICPGCEYNPHSRIQVATVQTLLSRKLRPHANLVVWDEGHHYVADDWARVREAYQSAHHVLLTATPERPDGSGLGDIADELVISANYSELVAAGHLVTCRVYQPPEHMGGDLALSPLAAYERHGDGGQAFLFAPSIKLATDLATDFAASGFRSASINGKTKRADRDQIMREFRSGAIRVLTNYNVLTEGVDVPQASVAILGRRFDHVSTYLQAAGRVLRPADGKGEAIIIDLSGATLAHGFPTEDREYSLTGKPIRRTQLEPLRNCLKCGATLPARLMECAECGYRFTRRDPRIPRIYSLELQEVFAGKQTPDDAKRKEYDRLRAFQRGRGWSPSWVAREYNRLFSEPVIIRDATQDEKIEELARLRTIAEKKGFKPGFAAVRFKGLFGHWPHRGM